MQVGHNTFLENKQGLDIYLKESLPRRNVSPLLFLGGGTYVDADFHAIALPPAAVPPPRGVRPLDPLLGVVGVAPAVTPPSSPFPPIALSPPSPHPTALVALFASRSVSLVPMTSCLPRNLSQKKFMPDST